MSGGRPRTFALSAVLGGRHRLDRLVAESPNATVFEAFHLTLGVKTAVKVLRRAAADRAAIERELSALKALRSEHVVRPIDYGAERVGDAVLPYLVLEWCDGGSLEEQLRARPQPLTAEQAIVMLRPVVEAVAEAHEAGLVHRDLKPANIMFARQSTGRLVPRVIDFGLASHGARDDVAGFSPAYAAPEQVLGEATGPFTDVHALGLVLVHLVVGAPPYGDRGGLAALEDERPTPRRFGVDVGPLEPLLVRALSREPSARPPHAGALGQELDRALRTIALYATARAPSTPAPLAGAPRVDAPASLAVEAGPSTLRDPGPSTLRDAPPGTLRDPASLAPSAPFPSTLRAAGVGSSPPPASPPGPSPRVIVVAPAAQEELGLLATLPASSAQARRYALAPAVDRSPGYGEASTTGASPRGITPVPAAPATVRDPSLAAHPASRRRFLFAGLGGAILVGGGIATWQLLDGRSAGRRRVASTSSANASAEAGAGSLVPLSRLTMLDLRAHAEHAGFKVDHVDATSLTLTKDETTWVLMRIPLGLEGLPADRRRRQALELVGSLVQQQRDLGHATAYGFDAGTAVLLVFFYGAAAGTARSGFDAIFSGVDLPVVGDTVGGDDPAGRAAAPKTPAWRATSVADLSFDELQSRVRAAGATVSWVNDPPIASMDLAYGGAIGTIQHLGLPRTGLVIGFVPTPDSELADLRKRKQPFSFARAGSRAVLCVGPGPFADTTLLARVLDKLPTPIERG